LTNYNFNIKRKRPEEKYQDVFEYFKDDQIIKYSTSKSMMRIQEKITLRALEIMNIQPQELILDAGSGCGFSSILLKELGFKVISIDIVKQLLSYYHNPELNPVLTDMCLIPFRNKVFGAIISISALQWIYSELNIPNMERDLKNLINSFYRILKPDGRIIIQFYPKNNVIMERIGYLFKKNNHFTGNFIIDNAKNSKKRKIFLLLEKQP
jgi:18S rRNA (guanine1575-N7)-methyltransferase